MTKGSSGRRGFAQIGREKIPKFAQWSGHMVDVGQKANSRVRAPPTMVLCVHVQTCQDTWCATSKTSTSATLFIPWGIMIRWQQIKELSEDKTNTFWSCADISLNHGVFQYSTSSENIDLNEDSTEDTKRVKLFLIFNKSKKIGPNLVKVKENM